MDCLTMFCPIRSCCYLQSNKVFLAKVLGKCVTFVSFPDIQVQQPRYFSFFFGTMAASREIKVTAVQRSTKDGAVQIKLKLPMPNNLSRKGLNVEFIWTEDDDPDDVAGELVRDLELPSTFIKPVSNSIASVIWTKLETPHAFQHIQHGPFSYRKNGKEYWLIVRISNESRAVIRYDVDHDEYCTFARYPRQMALHQTDTVFVSGNNDSPKLHLLSHSQDRCATFDLQTMEWELHSITYTLDYTYYQGQTRTFDDDVVFTMNRGRIQCLEYVASTSKVRVSTILGLGLKQPIENMLWVSSMKMLLTTSVKNEENTEDPGKAKWIDPDSTEDKDITSSHAQSRIFSCWNATNGMKSDINLSFNRVVECCLVFGTMVLMVIRCIVQNHYDIWCLDLVTNKCRKSICIPEIYATKIKLTTKIKLMVSSDFYLHCVLYGTQGKQHYKKKVSEIIPQTFYEIYREREFPLIVAYCRQSEEEFELNPIPEDVIQIVLGFYPVFG